MLRRGLLYGWGRCGAFQGLESPPSLVQVDGPPDPPADRRHGNRPYCVAFTECNGHVMPIRTRSNSCPAVDRQPHYGIQFTIRARRKCPSLVDSVHRIRTLLFSAPCSGSNNRVQFNRVQPNCAQSIVAAILLSLATVVASSSSIVAACACALVSIVACVYRRCACVWMNAWQAARPDMCYDPTHGASCTA